MTDVYSPSTRHSPGISSKPLDPSRCKAGVWDSQSSWPRYDQCQRKAGQDGWCKQHHPDAVAERAKASDAKYKASMRKAAMGFYGERMMRALIKIRDGDNDPRTTAAEALANIEYAQGDHHD